MSETPANDSRWALLWIACLSVLVLGAAVSPSPIETTCEHPGLHPGSRPDAGWVAVSCDAGTGLETPSGLAGLLFGLPIDLNRDPARALEALPGIGPARAGAIVAAREVRPFCALRDLERVTGIGPKSVERLRPLARARCGAPVAPRNSR